VVDLHHLLATGVSGYVGALWGQAVLASYQFCFQSTCILPLVIATRIQLLI
jgi:hypothetical protein